MLPPELVSSILEYVYYTPEGLTDYKSIRDCCLVCRSWRPIAQQLLFSRIALDNRIPQGALAYISNFLRGSHLGSHIRVIDIEIVANPVHNLAFANILVNCSHLYELGIYDTGVLSLDVETMSVLSRSPPFRALRIAGLVFESIIPYQLLSLTSSVRHLSLYSQLLATPPSKPINHSLYELVTRRAPDHDVLLWFLSASTGTLRLVEMWDTWDPISLQTVIDLHGPRIRSLRLLFYSDTATLIRGCSNLEELVLFTIPHSIAAHQLPRSITHIAFRYSVRASGPSFDPIFNAIYALPNLRLVTYDKSCITHTDFPRLEAICSKRNIELTWHSFNS